MASSNDKEGMGSLKELNQLVTVGHMEHFKVALISEITKLVNGGKSMPAKKWMKTVEVQKLLGVSAGKLQTMRKSGALCYTRIGGSLFYDPEDIQKMFEKGKITGDGY